MNKKPEDMKIHDALDLFEENKAEIKFFGSRCNIQEQVGRIMMSNNLFSPETDKAKLLSARLQKAIELIKPYLVTEEKRNELQEILKQRAYYKKELMARMAADGRDGFGNKSKPKDRARQQNGTKPKDGAGQQNGTKTKDGARQQNGAKPKDGARQQNKAKPKDGAGQQNGANSRNGNGQQDRTSSRNDSKSRNQRTDGNGSRQDGRTNTGNSNRPVKKITYKRGQKVPGEGNSVTIVEIGDNQNEIEVPLPSGEKMSLIPPYINSKYIAQCEQRFGVKLDIKKYLIIEMTPDKKTLFVNVVYGKLDLDLMHRSQEYLELCMKTILDKKRINEVCRNHFCTLDKINQTGPKSFSTTRDESVDKIVAASIIENSEEIRTPRPKTKGFFGLFGGQVQTEEENILRFHKTGVMIVEGKQCLVYSYGTKDQTTGETIEVGSFIVSGLDEERFKTDTAYHNAVIKNVITPTRLMNSRRADIPYPYIGEVTPDGDFVNNFDIIKALNDIQIQI